MQSVRIESINLSDIGPFTELVVPFGLEPGLNLLCGDNGIGKSTLLESIAAVFSDGQNPRLKKREGAKRGNVAASVRIGGEMISAGVAVKEFAPQNHEWLSGPFSPYSASVINVRAARDIYYIPQPSIARDPVVEPTRGFSERLAAGLDGSEIKQWFCNRYLLKPYSHTSGWTSEMLENIASAEAFFSLLEPSVKLDRVDVRTFDIVLTTPNGTIPFEYMSSGYRSIFYLLLGILKEIEFRQLGVSARNFTGLILIDELDLHLHPAWQQEVGGVLKSAFPRAQIIASTHSPHVIQAAQASEVVALVRGEGGVVRPRSVTSTRYGFAGWTVEEVLEDIMGVKDTKTSIFRLAMQKFDDALDHDDSDAVVATLSVLREMLHPESPMRKLLEIQASPHIGATAVTKAHS